MNIYRIVALQKKHFNSLMSKLKYPVKEFLFHLALSIPTMRIKLDKSKKSLSVVLEI